MSDIGEVIKEIRKEAAAITGSALNFNTEEFDVLLLEQIEAICFSKQLINKFSAAELKTIVDTVFNQMRRHDVLEPLINDKSITEIMINGPDKVLLRKMAWLRKPILFLKAGKDSTILFKIWWQR